MRGMRGAVAALAEAGNDVIVDEVMWDLEALADYRRRLAAFEFHVVALHALLDVIEQRDQRGDRDLGLRTSLAVQQDPRRDDVRSGARHERRRMPAEIAAKIKATFVL